MPPIPIPCPFCGISIVWMHDHSGISGNWKADELARRGRLTPLTLEWDTVGSRLVFCILALNQLILCVCNPQFLKFIKLCLARKKTLKIWFVLRQVLKDLNIILTLNAHRLQNFQK